MLSEAVLRRVLRADAAPAILSRSGLARHVLRVWILSVLISLAADLTTTALIDPAQLKLALLRGFLIPTCIAVPIALRSGVILRQAARRAAALADLVRRDQQTGLLHHNAFIEDAAAALTENEARVLLVGDIDRFKTINDSCGHLAGDRVILAVGEVVRDLFDRTSVTGRIGGEEFAVLMLMPFADPVAAHHAALAFAQEWRKRITELRVDGIPFPITISIGVARSSAGETFDSLYSRADRALYVAKTSGRNRVAADEHEIGFADGPWPDESPAEIAWVEEDGAASALADPAGEAARAAAGRSVVGF